MWDQSLTSLIPAQHNINTKDTFTATPSMGFEHMTTMLKR